MEIWHDWQISPNNGWHGAERLDGSATLIVPVRNNVTGSLELFYVGVNGALFHNGQTSPGGPLWAGETEIPTSSDGVRQFPGGSLAVGQNGDGRWELLSIGASYQLYHRSQMSPGGTWADETAFPGETATSIAVGQNADSRLELFYIGTDLEQLYHKWQTSPGGNWTDKNSFPGDSASFIAVVLNPNRCLELFYIGTNSHLYHRWQMSPNGARAKMTGQARPRFPVIAPPPLRWGRTRTVAWSFFTSGLTVASTIDGRRLWAGARAKTTGRARSCFPVLLMALSLVALSPLRWDRTRTVAWSFFTPHPSVVSSIDGRRLRTGGRAKTTGLARPRFPVSVTKCAFPNR